MESEAAQQREGCAAHHEVLLHTGMKYFRPNTCRPTALLFPIFLQHCFIVAVVQSLSHVQLFAAPWTAACQASLSNTNTWGLLKLMSIVGDAIQPSHPLSTPSPPTYNLSQHHSLFKWIRSSHQIAKVLEFQLQHQFLQWIFRTDLL